MIFLRFFCFITFSVFFLLGVSKFFLIQKEVVVVLEFVVKKVALELRWTIEENVE